MRFFSHMHPIAENEELVVGERFVYEAKPGLIGRITTEFSRMQTAKELTAAVRDFQPDLIYLRWSMYVFPAHRLLRIAPTVIEINTNDVEEHKLLGPILNAYNRLTRGLLLGRAAGLVYATREMAELDIIQKVPKTRDRGHQQSGFGNHTLLPRA